MSADEFFKGRAVKEIFFLSSGRFIVRCGCGGISLLMKLNFVACVEKVDPGKPHFLHLIAGILSPDRGQDSNKRKECLLK